MVLLPACLWLTTIFPHRNSFLIPVVQQCMKLQTPGKIFHGASISVSVAKHLELIRRFPLGPSSADWDFSFIRLHVSWRWFWKLRGSRRALIDKLSYLPLHTLLKMWNTTMLVHYFFQCSVVFVVGNKWQDFGYEVVCKQLGFSFKVKYFCTVVKLQQVFLLRREFPWLAGSHNVCSWFKFCIFFFLFFSFSSPV